jgi:flagellar protein FliO/FliZ
MSLTDILSSVAALALVLGLILLVRFGVRFLPRRTAANRDASLRLDAVLPLDNRRRLHLVSCGGRQLLLLTGGATDVSVGWLEPVGAARSSAGATP